MDIEDLQKKLKSNYPESYDFLMKAYEFAKAAHGDILRYSGEPYITHPCEVVNILIDFGADVPTLAAAFLHDVLEDTNATPEELKEAFGDEVLGLVQGVTKLNRMPHESRVEQRAENVRMVFFAMAKDLRVIFIKLADRLHNMRTLDARKPEKQIEVATETLQIYAALAGRLGISYFKCELEDLSMKYLYPEEYKEISDYLAATEESRRVSMEEMKESILEKMSELGIHGDVSGRLKHRYSIYKKLKALNVSIDQIYDINALRIIVDDVDSCYAVLGMVHKLWKPLPTRIKDYITMPKPNNYQSLHTTVLNDKGDTFEIQIRTYEMHKIAEYGVAAHYKYKEGTLGAESDLDKKVSWLREIMDSQRNVVDAQDFLDYLKIDVFKEEVFVFTPKGDVVSLPDNSTAIDFAYHVHSEVGNRCVGVKINKKIVPLNTVLKSGDIVEIVMSNNNKGPSRDWLKIVKTASARQKIKQYFKREKREENIECGKTMLEYEAKKHNTTFSSLVTEEWKTYIFAKYNYNTIDDVFAAVGYGEYTAAQVLARMVEFLRKAGKEEELFKVVTPKRRHKNSCGVLLNGDDDFGTKLAHCCNPVKGDPIIGFISQGNGISVHRADCPNIKGLEKEKLIYGVSWDENYNEKFVAGLKIFSENSEGALASITTCISNRHIQIVAANLRVNHQTYKAKITVQIEISDLTELTELINRLKSLPNVIDIVRD